MESLIILRLIHIVCAVIWTGSMVYFALFVIPASQSLGSDGNKFIQRLTSTNKMPVVMNVAAIFAILSGILLMRKLFGGLTIELLSSSHGAIIIIGSLLALIGFLIGFLVNFPAARRMNAIAKNIATSDTLPEPRQLKELQKLRNKSFAAAKIIAVLLFASLILMSIVKYY